MGLGTKMNKVGFVVVFELPPDFLTTKPQRMAIFNKIIIPSTNGLRQRKGHFLLKVNFFSS